MAERLILWIALLLSWLSILFGLPGTLLMLLSAVVYGWATGFEQMSSKALAELAAIAVPAELLDQLLGIWTARRYGSSWIGMAGAFVGGLVGASLLGSLLPIVGVVPGALLGGFAGTFAAEYASRRDARAALRAAWGGFVGRIAGILLKMAAGVLIAFWVYRVLR